MKRRLSPCPGDQHKDDITVLKEGKHTDVEFRVSYGPVSPKVIRADKTVLARRNKVFARMFYGIRPVGAMVTITNQHPDGFDTLIKHLGGQKPVFSNIKQALHTRAAAQEYSEPTLVEYCDAFINDAMKATDVCDVLEYTMKHGNVSKFDNIIGFLLEMKAQEVLESKSFLAASRETVTKILKNPRLRIKEYELIKRVGAWVVEYSRENTPNASTTEMQKVMKPFLADLRFLTLTPLEFVEGPSSWNYFTELDAFAVLSNIIKRGSKPLPEGVCTITRRRT
ncbi:unnamed protein product [Ixodes hexagonus]